jgi:hypothetical protein
MLRLFDSARAKSSSVTASLRVGRAVAGEGDMCACDMSIATMLAGPLVSFDAF